MTPIGAVGDSSSPNMETRKTYPLPDNFFQIPELSDMEKAHYLEVGTTALKSFVNNVLGPENPTLVWRPFGEFQGVKIVEADVPGFKVDKNLLPYRMTAKIQGTIDEVAMLHASDSRQHCAEYVDQYRGDILDVIPLYSLIERSDANPYKQCYIKWSAHLSAVVVIRDRDYLFVEMQDLVDLPSGRRGWAFCRVSIELMNVPNLERTSLKLVRGVLHHYGAIFMEAAGTPGKLDVIAQMAVDSKGSIPQWVRKLGMKNNVRQITLVEDYVHKLRMSSRISKGQSFLSTSGCSGSASTTTPAPGAHKRCALCHAPSSALKRYKPCESCGDLCCPRCSTSWNVNVKGKPRVRVCAACANDAQSREKWEIHDADETATNSSSRETLFLDAVTSQRSSAFSSQRANGPTLSSRGSAQDVASSSRSSQEPEPSCEPIPKRCEPSHEPLSSRGGDVNLGVDLSYLSIYNKKPTTERRPSLAAAMDSVVYAGEYEYDDNDVTCSTLDSVHDPIQDSNLEAFLNQIGHVHVAAQRDSFADRRSSLVR
ncbi:hypothetical protein, variant [Saprolegnia diclina VS20]|uniref:FYVE-type domain-containing protein n=1 Tax=Saprolegnia diclina (strain VS20) TaxID=1156394 RepID=T0QJB0_SAPDV|nr:hypothetical protein SDRG_08516 [Saprolegnia diclina VS20]XP_008612630.1 hypothetical protein, variant [Saprolegnia diclina VS20]EQC33834.1 hypothetical protein SDRG_08516 [Saprolegnia diclina VS20]EQC33835.1 hypothetical protein, variant [Saprolegnia diclina VS20]|eukprot:XP_008612629.1 hypothetical protein SDRG_08516 [Saprolegnia diclina VS20]